MYVSIDATKFTFVRSENSHIVCMIWTTSNCTVTLNGKKYMNGTWIEQDGEYAFVITNDAKRSTTYKFMVDHYYAKYSMVAPTCTQKSYTIYKCMGCVGSYNGDYIEAKGHEYETKVVRDLHCETMDERGFYCTKCGAIITQNMDGQYEQFVYRIFFRPISALYVLGTFDDSRRMENCDGYFLCDCAEERRKRKGKKDD